MRASKSADGRPSVSTLAAVVVPFDPDLSTRSRRGNDERNVWLIPVQEPVDILT
jgi:hypothetical protein